MVSTLMCTTTHCKYLSNLDVFNEIKQMMIYISIFFINLYLIIMQNRQYLKLFYLQ